MPQKVLQFGIQSPAERGSSVVASAIFFPGEVVRILGLEGIDYRQLRQLLKLGRELRGEPQPDRSWARFTLADIAATEALIGISGGREALEPGRRLRLSAIKKACVALQELGFSNPLMQVRLVRLGGKVLAQVGTHVLEPSSGQLLLGVLDRVNGFIDEHLVKDSKIRRAIRSEKRKLIARIPRTVNLPDVTIDLVSARVENTR